MSTPTARTRALLLPSFLPLSETIDSSKNSISTMAKRKQRKEPKKATGYYAIAPAVEVAMAAAEEMELKSTDELCVDDKKANSNEQPFQIPIIAATLIHWKGKYRRGYLRKLEWEKAGNTGPVPRKRLLPHEVKLQMKLCENLETPRCDIHGAKTALGYAWGTNYWAVESNWYPHRRNSVDTSGDADDDDDKENGGAAAAEPRAAAAKKEGELDANSSDDDYVSGVESASPLAVRRPKKATAKQPPPHALLLDSDSDMDLDTPSDSESGEMFTKKVATKKPAPPESDEGNKKVAVRVEDHKVDPEIKPATNAAVEPKRVENKNKPNPKSAVKTDPEAVINDPRDLATDQRSGKSTHGHKLASARATAEQVPDAARSGITMPESSKVMKQEDKKDSKPSVLSAKPGAHEKVQRALKACADKFAESLDRIEDGGELGEALLIWSNITDGIHDELASGTGSVSTSEVIKRYKQKLQEALRSAELEGAVKAIAEVLESGGGTVGGGPAPPAQSTNPSARGQQSSGDGEKRTVIDLRESPGGDGRGDGEEAAA